MAEQRLLKQRSTRQGADASSGDLHHDQAIDNTVRVICYDQNRSRWNGLPDPAHLIEVVECPNGRVENEA